MNFPNEAWQVIGTIVAAMLAGLVSFVVAILSKDQKTSEFRQTWIDALRQELSDFAATAISISEVVRRRQQIDSSREKVGDHLMSDKYTEVKLIEGLRVRILLRLNPKEHSELIKLLGKAYAFIPEVGSDTSAEGEELIEKFISESQRVLKKEWRRVKRGEVAFFLTKWFSLALFVAALVTGYMYARGHVAVAYVPSQETPSK